MIQIRSVDEQEKDGSRILFRYKPPKNLISEDPNDLSAAQMRSIRAAFQGIPACVVSGK